MGKGLAAPMYVATMSASKALGIETVFVLDGLGFLLREAFGGPVLVLVGPDITSTEGSESGVGGACANLLVRRRGFEANATGESESELSGASSIILRRWRLEATYAMEEFESESGSIVDT